MTEQEKQILRNELNAGEDIGYFYTMKLLDTLDERDREVSLYLNNYKHMYENYNSILSDRNDLSVEKQCLQEENQRLRKALEYIATSNMTPLSYVKIARKALSGESE